MNHEGAKDTKEEGRRKKEEGRRKKEEGRVGKLALEFTRLFLVKMQGF